MEIHGLFSSDDDSREEQQRCASSWGWPEECRFRDPVHPVAGSSWLAGVRGFVLLCRCCVVTYVRGPDLTAGLHFSIRAQVGNSAWLVLCLESGGYLSRLAVLSFESVHGPRLYPAQDLPQDRFPERP